MLSGVMQRPLKLPTKPRKARAESKALWNEARSPREADFFTIGYEGRSTEELFNLLADARVRTLIDVRHTPLSMYRPELSKSNFQRLIERAGMNYVHSPEWGVPKDIRARALGHATREPIWDWYDTQVISQYFKYNLHWFLNMEHPSAFMCVEHDPEECHRHRIFMALERNGLRGYDL